MILLFVACVVPLSGNYLFSVVSETSDCPDSYESSGDPSGTQTVTVEEDEVILAGEPDEHCKRDGLQFSCSFSEVDSTIDYSDRGMNAAVTIDAEMEGEWLASDTLEGTMSVATSCEGADCDTLEAAGAPSCTMSWEFSGVLQ